MTEPVSWADLVKDAGEVGTFEPVPDGDYDLLVVDATFKPTKQGKRMWSTKNRIEGGPYNGKPVWDNLVVTTDNPNALMFFFKKMAVLGLSKDYFMTNPSDSQVSEQLKGKKFRATLDTRTYNGTRSNSVKTYHDTGAASASPTLPASVSAPPPPAAAPPPPAAAPPPKAAAPPPKVAAPKAEDPVESYTPPPEAPVPTEDQEPAMAGAVNSPVPAPSSPPPPPF